MRPPAIESTANRLDHPRIAIEPKETVGAEIDHSASAHSDLAARTHLVDHQVLQMSLRVRPFKILEDPHQLVLRRARISLSMGSSTGMASPWLTGKRDANKDRVVKLRHYSSDSLDWRTWEVRRIRRANTQGTSRPGRTADRRSGWSEYRKNRKSSSSACWQRILRTAWVGSRSFAHFPYGSASGHCGEG